MPGSRKNACQPPAALRARRARVLALILQEHDFAVETKGDLVIGRLRNLGWDPMAKRLEMIGRLIGYSRQIGVRGAMGALLKLHFRKSGCCCWRRTISR